MKGIQYLVIHFAVAQGTLPWEPMFGSNLRMWPTPPSFVAFAFQKYSRIAITISEVKMAIIPLHWATSLFGLSSVLVRTLVLAKDSVKD